MASLFGVKPYTTAKSRLRKVYATLSVRGRPLEDPLTTAALTPAENLKADTTKGPIEIGKDVGLVVLTPDLTVSCCLY